MEPVEGGVRAATAKKSAVGPRIDLFVRVERRPPRLRPNRGESRGIFGEVCSTAPPQKLTRVKSVKLGGPQATLREVKIEDLRSSREPTRSAWPLIGASNAIPSGDAQNCGVPSGWMASGLQLAVL